jgi:PAS domain S-box-containing protein
MPPDHRKFSQSLLRKTTLLYFLLGFSWIIASAVLNQDVNTPALFPPGLIKDVSFFAFTCLLFFLLGKWFISRIGKLASENSRQDKELAYLNKKLEITLAEYQLLFENHPLPMWIYDIDSLKFLSVNNAAVQSYGYSEQEFLEMTCDQIRPAEDLKSFYSNVAASSDMLFSSSGQWRHLMKNGEIIDVEINSHSVIFKGKKCRLVFAKNVTQRLDAQRRLVQSEATLKSILDSSIQCIYLLDRDCKLITFNKNAEEFIEYLHDDKLVIGVDFTKYIGEDYQETFRQNVQRALEGETLKVERKSKLPQLKEIWFEFIFSPVKDEFGAFSGVNFSSRDITNRMRREEDLKNSRSNLFALIENTDDYIWSVDKEGVLIAFNKNFRMMYRELYKKEVFIGMRTMDTPDQLEKQFWMEILSHGKSGKRVKKEYDLKVGRASRNYEISFNPIIDTGGYTGGISIYCRDITLNKKVVKDLLYKNQELDTFVYKVSHDLIGPISSMKGLCNIARLELQDEKAHFYFNMVMERVNRLHNIVLTLIQLTKIKEGERNLSIIDFKKIVEDSLQLFENYPRFAEIDFKISVNLKGGFESDSGLIKTVVQNLVENAIKYQDELKKPFVHIHISDEGANGITLQVKDNGVGIDEANKDKIFNMFYRADLRSNGSGLGLYIVKNAVEKLEGTIEVQSIPKKGSSFSIFLPRPVPLSLPVEAL